MEKPIFVIDGSRFNDLESFYDEVEHCLIPEVEWGRNLDHFNDILRGNVGLLPRAYILIWKNMSKSRLDLGYEETIKFWEEVKDRWMKRVRILEEQVQHSESKSLKDKKFIEGMIESSKSSLIKWTEDFEAAQRHEGPTIFDWIMEMIFDERKQIEFHPE